ncbi:MAG TPA: extracellular solute-binding protein [Candidatus Obscuribacterales bacterium]
MARYHLTRREFLWGSAALALQLAGCGGQERSPLVVALLENSVPTELIQEFTRRIGRGTKLDFEPIEQLQDTFRRLQTLEANSPNIPDWMTLGDAWLAAAIQQDLIRPIANLETLDAWAQLPPQWQALVRRDRQGAPQPEGDIWAAPYRWGSLVLVYSVAAMEKLNWVPSQWEDLWRPDLQGRISVPDSARVVIGLILKQLGQSANQVSLDEAAVADRLAALHQQMRFYSSDAYLEPLLRDDTWLAVGWSTDVLPFIQRDRRLKAVIPDAGTLLFADLWVQPRNAPTPGEMAMEWIEFCWQPDIAERITTLSLSTSPQLQPSDPDAIASVVDTSPLLWPGEAVIERSEWLAPLPEEAIATYRDLWLKVRKTG